MNEIDGQIDSSFECEISYRTDEKYWISGGENNFSVIFSINFTNETDSGLAKIILFVKSKTN
jgi:hypothetical protein